MSIETQSVPFNPTPPPQNLFNCQYNSIDEAVAAFQDTGKVSGYAVKKNRLYRDNNEGRAPIDRISCAVKRKSPLTPIANGILVLVGLIVLL